GPSRPPPTGSSSGSSRVRVHVSVPATSANPGPGFDALGLAWALHNEVVLSEAEGVSVAIEGEGAARLPRTADNMVARGVKLAYDATGRPFKGCALACTNRVPSARGLGSSAAAGVGGLAAGRARRRLRGPAARALPASVVPVDARRRQGSARRRSARLCPEWCRAVAARGGRGRRCTGGGRDGGGAAPRGNRRRRVRARRRHVGRAEPRDRLSAVPDGVLPDHELRAAVRDGWIRAERPIGDDQYQPASLDLRLGSSAYQLRASFLPFRQTVQSRLEARDLTERDL